VVGVWVGEALSAVGVGVLQAFSNSIMTAIRLKLMKEKYFITFKEIPAIS
jgi:hypothetical protein